MLDIISPLYSTPDLVLRNYFRKQSVAFVHLKNYENNLDLYRT